MPAFAGAVRPGELTNGIKHALALIVGANFLSRAPGGGWVWPATAADGGWESSYVGQDITNLYMGSLVAIPRTLDINSLGLALPQSVTLARALQQYGAYAVDRGEQGVMDLVFDGRTYSEWVPWWNDPNRQSDMHKIGAVCRIVKNSFGPNGGKPQSGTKLNGGDGTLGVSVAPSFAP